MSVAGTRVKVWQARPVATPEVPCERGSITAHGVLCTADGGLALEEVQPEGKRVMAATAWRAGLRVDAQIDA
jgi:methionyl-tRNA formyltransferase